MQNSFDIVIEPNKVEKNYWSDIWRYRELFYILSWRDIKVRYKQTVVGVMWSVIRPLLTMIVFTFVFNKVAGLQSGNVPYPVFILAGLLPWQFFANALTESSNSLIGNEKLISKVYFPRIVIPAASVITSLLDLMISFGILLVMLLIYQVMPSWQIVFLPFFILLAFLTSIGVGLWIAALNVKYRDFRYIIPFIVQFGLYISPVGFSSSVIPEKYKWLYSLNPMVGVIDGFRWCILGDTVQVYWTGILISLGVTFFFLWLGINRFRKMEKMFADLI
jgi:lipopolysaccharide transport system permease protein